MRKQKGFSLIELLIVVAIILIIAAIAIPNLLKSRISANDAAAASTIRTLATTEITFTTTYPDKGYAADLKTLGPNATCDYTHACLIDATLGCTAAFCPKGGYSYAITASATTIPVPDFTATATPISLSTGSKNYCSNEDAVIRYQPVGTTPLTTAVTHTACAGSTFTGL